MRVVRNSGSTADVVGLGEDLQLRIEIDQDSAFGLFARNLEARWRQIFRWTPPWTFPPQDGQRRAAEPDRLDRLPDQRAHLPLPEPGGRLQGPRRQLQGLPLPLHSHRQLRGHCPVLSGHLRPRHLYRSVADIIVARIKVWHSFGQKNPAYGRQRISRPMRMVGPTLERLRNLSLKEERRIFFRWLVVFLIFI